MDGYPSLSTKIFLVSAALSIVSALHTPARQFAISCTFLSGRRNALSIIYLVRAFFHCFQCITRILSRAIHPYLPSDPSGTSYCSILPRYSYVLSHLYLPRLLPTFRAVIGLWSVLQPHPRFTAYRDNFYRPVVCLRLSSDPTSQ